MAWMLVQYYKFRMVLSYILMALVFVKVIGAGFRAQYPERYGREESLFGKTAMIYKDGTPFYLKRVIKTKANKNVKAQ